MTRRLKLGPWLLIWAVLSVAQGYVLTATIDTAMGVGIAVALALQLAKVPITAWRLYDLGRAPDDAVLGLVPIANIGLFFQILGGTPKEEIRQKRLAQWEGEITSLQAFGKAFSLLIGGLPIFAAFIVPAAMLSAGFYVFCESFLVWADTAPAESVESARQTLFGAAGLLVLWGLFQLPKRHRASRMSWIPSLFAIPAAMLGLALQLHGSKDLGPFVVSAPYEALDLIWQVLFGSLLAIVWLTVGDALLRGEKPSFDQVSRNLRARWADVIAVHGGAATAVWVGLQVVIPGIHYLLVYAFTDHAVLFEPEKPAYQRSGRLTFGIRRRIFKAMYLSFLVYVIPAFGLELALLGPEKFFASLMDPRGIPWTTAVVGQVLWLLMVALSKLTLLVMYRERVELEAKRDAELQAAAPVAPKPVTENVVMPQGAP
jgi:hypothetical protein